MGFELRYQGAIYPKKMEYFIHYRSHHLQRLVLAADCVPNGPSPAAFPSEQLRVAVMVVPGEGREERE